MSTDHFDRFGYEPKLPISDPVQTGTYVSVEISFETISMGGASDLLFWLKAGKQYHEDRDKRFGRAN